MSKRNKRFGLYPKPTHVVYDYLISNFETKKKFIASASFDYCDSDKEIYSRIYDSFLLRDEDKEDFLDFIGVDLYDELKEEDEIEAFESLDLGDREATIKFISKHICEKEKYRLHSMIMDDSFEFFQEDLEYLSEYFESKHNPPLIDSDNKNRVIIGDNLKEVILECLSSSRYYSEFNRPITAAIYEDEVTLEDPRGKNVIFHFNHENFISEVINILLDQDCPFRENSTPWYSPKEILKKYRGLQYHVERCWKDGRTYPLNPDMINFNEPFGEISRSFFDRSFRAAMGEEISKNNLSKVPEYPQDLGYETFQDLLADSFLPALSIMGSYYGSFFSNPAYKISRDEGYTISDAVPPDILDSLNQSSQVDLRLQLGEDSPSDSPFTDSLITDGNFFDTPTTPRSVLYCQLLFK